jgi:hypothetical protein
MADTPAPLETTMPTVHPQEQGDKAEMQKQTRKDRGRRDTERCFSELMRGHPPPKVFSEQHWLSLFFFICTENSPSPTGAIVPEKDWLSGTGFG